MARFLDRLMIAAAAALMLGLTVPQARAQSSQPSVAEQQLRDVLGRPENPARTGALAAPHNSTGPGVGTMVKGLAFCLGLFFIGIYLVRRVKGGQPISSKRSLKVLERLPLSNRCSICVVAFENQKMVLTVGSDQVTVLRDDQFLLSHDEATEPAKQ
jgi:flagellar biogenesis protein FliO